MYEMAPETHLSVNTPKFNYAATCFCRAFERIDSLASDGVSDHPLGSIKARPSDQTPPFSGFQLFNDQAIDSKSQGKATSDSGIKVNIAWILPIF